MRRGEIRSPGAARAEQPADEIALSETELGTIEMVLEGQIHALAVMGINPVMLTRARAKDSSWRWPAEKLVPRSRTSVS